MRYSTGLATARTGLVMAGLAVAGLVVFSIIFSVLARAEELSSDGPNAFRLHRDGMNSAEIADFNYGRGLFRHLWEPVLYSDNTSSGFGPLYNGNSCVSCHIRDGRGHPPDPVEGADATSFVMRLGIGFETIDGYKMVLPDPVYGFQLQDKAIEGQVAEGQIRVSYKERELSFADGEAIFLRVPEYTIVNPGYGPFDADLKLGPRVAPQLIGLGLLEQIPVKALELLQDIDDADGDGISGQINWSLPDDKGIRLPGRFGWKLTTVSVREQSEMAANADMGLATPMTGNFAGDCTSAQSQCLNNARLSHFNKPFELDGNETRLLAFYTANLKVPERRGENEPAVIAGGQIFENIGCAACHTTSFELEDGRLIAPFTDLLLHDMGTVLADGIEVGVASVSQWRTAPLWGIGLTELVSGHTQFLHDGRARNLSEAIVWHGGEGAGARDRFMQLPVGDRAHLLAFLNSL